MISKPPLSESGAGEKLAKRVDFSHSLRVLHSAESRIAACRWKTLLMGCLQSAGAFDKRRALPWARAEVVFDLDQNLYRAAPLTRSSPSKSSELRQQENVFCSSENVSEREDTSGVGVVAAAQFPNFSTWSTAHAWSYMIYWRSDELVGLIVKRHDECRAVIG